MTDNIDTIDAPRHTQSSEDKNARPVKPDGTTDWSVVFDDPDRGVIAAVRSASNPKQLASVLSQVAILLYRRKRDAEPRAAFQDRVKKILAEYEGDDFLYARGEIVRMLEKEKYRRIRKAEQYVKNKRLSQGIERRKATEQKAPALWSRMPVVLAAGALGVVLVMFIGSFILPFGGEDGDRASVTDSARLAAEASRETAARSPRASEPEGSPPVTVPAVILQPTPVTVQVNGRSRALLIVPIVELSDADEWEPLCAIAPRVSEGISFAVHDARNGGRDLSPSELNSAATRIWRSVSDYPSLDMAARPLMLRFDGDVPRKLVASARNGCARVDLPR